MGRVLQRIKDLSSKVSTTILSARCYLLFNSYSLVCSDVVWSEQGYYIQYQHTPRRRRKRGIFHEKKTLTYCSFLKVATTIL
jgi:hypothetical protein